MIVYSNSFDIEILRIQEKISRGIQFLKFKGTWTERATGWTVWVKMVVAALGFGAIVAS